MEPIGLTDAWNPVVPTGDGEGAIPDEVALAQPHSWVESKVVEVAPGTDLFHPDFDMASLQRLVSVIGSTPQHSYLLLTERAKRLLVLGNEGLPFPRNLWVGVPVRSDDEVWRAEDLLRCNSPRSWVLADPLAGPLPSLPVGMFSWIVCGTGTGSVDTGWLRDLRDRCVAAGVPFWLRSRSGGAPVELDGRTWDERPPDLWRRDATAPAGTRSDG